MHFRCALPAILFAATLPPTATTQAPLPGVWRGALDLAGATLPFELRIEQAGTTLEASLCNGTRCDTRAGVVARGDSVYVDITDYEATIAAVRRGDSLVGSYSNVGRAGPRTIPFRASRGSWPESAAPQGLPGEWDAWFITDQRRSPRLLVFRNGERGLEGGVISNTGDLGGFWGRAVGDSFMIARFDGNSVYVLAGRLRGDTLRGVFHAGLRTQTPYLAVRSSGAPHLSPPTAITSADTITPFHFAFPDLQGRLITEDDPRFKGKVVLVDIFGSWCVTCHEATPHLLELYREYHPRGLEILGLGYEVTGDSARDNPAIRRFRDKFAIPWPLLHAGMSVVEATATSLPQLHGFTAYPTTLFLGRDGRIRIVYAGFRGPSSGAQHQKQIADYRHIIESLLAEKPL